MNHIEALALRVADLESRLESLACRLRVAERRVGWGALSYAVTADKVGVDVRTLRRMVASGRFPRPVRYGGKRVFFRAQDVGAYLEGDWTP